MKDKILLTGGAGFIGSEFVRQYASAYKIVVVDKLTYAGDVKRLEEVKKKIIFYKADIAHFQSLKNIFKKERPAAVIHFAAETHVDRSIIDNNPFILSNIIGTQNLVNLAILHKVKKFLHISTDEVYGPSKKGRFKENDPLKPNNPYAATKASAEHLVRASQKTFQLPAIIVRPSNNYGYWQYPEKFVPVIILKALRNQRIPVYGRGEQIREWLHVSDCAAGIQQILTRGKVGEIYNIGSSFERSNITTARTILRYLNKPESLIQFVKDRPGHDFRYSVSCAPLMKLGWRPEVDFPSGMKLTIEWYKNNQPWLVKKSQFLKNYWKKVYHPSSPR